MSNEQPTLSTYEDMAETSFDLSEEDFDRDAINEELAALFS